MQIVIDLSDEIAQGIIEKTEAESKNIVRDFRVFIVDAIKNGTPLPKGHGRLIDLNDLYDFDRRKVEYASTIVEADTAEDRRERSMIGKITDENSMRTIVTNGIIPAIGNVLKSEGTVDSKIAEITNLVNAYNDFYLTGRRIDQQGESES